MEAEDEELAVSAKVATSCFDGNSDQTVILQGTRGREEKREGGAGKEGL